MPAKTLPIFSRAEVESHKTAKSCFVTLGNKVYDVTDFLEAHPGGGELILDWAGKDVGDILKDEDSHLHTETAYEVLDESLVGFLSAPNGKSLNGNANGTGTDAVQNGNGEYVHPRTGMSKEEDLSVETNYDIDYKKHKFLDLNKPLLLQVWFGGFSKDFYLDQIHRPRHYKGGNSAPIFGNFLEPLSMTPWWVIPTVWLPLVLYGLYLARPGFNSVFEEAGFFAFGVFVWTLIEYGLHRFLFHLD
jgi:4-hydroxysphinganine ceramide fatty acyl 2-hydroxylase